MRIYLVAITTFIVILTFSILFSEPSSKNNIKDMSAAEAKKLIDNNKNDTNFVILDVRTKDEYNTGHIKNAINIDYYSNDFVDKIDKLNKNKKYLLYCRSGRRSKNAANIMAKKGFKTLYNLLGGIKAWIKNSYKLDKE